MSLEDLEAIGLLLLLFVGVPFVAVILGSNWAWHTTVDQNPQEITYTFSIPSYQNADMIQYSVHDNAGFPVLPKYYVRFTATMQRLPCNVTFTTKDANITITLSVDYFQSLDGLLTQIGHKDYLINLGTTNSTNILEQSSTRLNTEKCVSNPRGEE